METPRLIGLYSSRPQSGKSTVADILFQHYGYSERRFAGPLKAMLRTVLDRAGLSAHRIHQIETVAKERPIEEFGGKSYRHLAQTLGTEWGRNCVDKDLWVHLTLPHLPLSRTVIDDVRFYNEFRRIRELGGQMWLIARPGVAAPNGHESEGRLDYASFDRVIMNNGGLPYLRTQVDQALT